MTSLADSARTCQFQEIVYLSRDPHVFNIACERYSLGLTLYLPVRKDIYLLNVNILLAKLLLDCVFTKRLKPKPQQVLSRRAIP